MNSIEIKRFLDEMTAVVIDAGKIAIENQDKVINIGKDIEDIEDSRDERASQRASAKTEIDERIQEILLKSVKNIIGTDVKIDAEEDTPSKTMFNNDSPITVVIDPIDGTLNYINGEDQFSINIGLVEDGKMLAFIVYYPAKRQLYLLDETKTPFLITYNQNDEIDNRLVIKASILNDPKSVYVNNRINSQIIERLQDKFQVVMDDGGVMWPEALLKTISGDYKAAIFKNPQTRDILFGAIVENLGGYMSDWQGNKINWPNGGRIPQIIFGFGELPQEIIESLS
ncbi:MAG: hypothetical protein KBD51_03285 [Candidatus Levybacteria bacterium]|nr:hypothetical protein [Candidatus Levybacteria bacterium]